ncbi:MAG: Asp23/Gls24 family envelope stress response protein [Candidatus Omnitrophota bacterium]|nr:Asp23/Gls24 family envelope stress response protein [Candidatus Omnitrophota bacterium]
MSRNISSEYGQIKIHRRVVVQIAETSARQISGVKRVGWECYGMWKGILKFFNLAGTRVSQENELRIVIPVTIVWKENIVDVAYEIQKKIISQMLDSLNIDTVVIDVKVKRVERSNEAAPTNVGA